MKNILAVLSAVALSASLLYAAPELPELKKASQSYLTVECYELEGIRYSRIVTDPSLQYMNIWIPAQYVKEDGSWDWEAEVNGFTAATAPIIFRNNCSGWMSSSPENDTENKIGLNSYMENGYVYVACGARSRDASNGDSLNHYNWGKAPAPIVDLKAGIRALRALSGLIPGDVEKIITIGGSGAGQMSALLGASGDVPAYYPYLYEMGAEGIELVDGEYVSTISDAVFASQVYYPITDLDNSDMAYSWLRLYAGDRSLKMTWPSPIDIQFTPFQYALEEDLSEAFVSYLNTRGYADKDGNPLVLTGVREGSYYEAVCANLTAALQAYLAELDEEAAESYLGLLLATGDWIALEDGMPVITSVDGFFRNAGVGTPQTAGTPLSRNKNIPGFDSFSKDAENNAFGYPEDVAVHYSASLASVLRDNLGRYEALMSEEEKRDREAFLSDFEGERGEYIAKQVYLMNPLRILESGEGKIAGKWRIRSGTADQHASLLACSYNLALAAEARGAEADYALVWAMPHFNEREGTSTGTFTCWVNEIAR